MLFRSDPTGEFVYGAEMSYNKRPVYLYVCKPLQLIENVVAQMNIRTLLLAVFVLLLSFTISSAISGVLTKPITEMTEKAKLLARGDFSVDFHGKSYGSEMELLAETLNFARDEIAKADQMQKELIANVSHDFKTPLTMIKAYLLSGQACRNKYITKASARSFIPQFPMLILQTTSIPTRLSLSTSISGHTEKSLKRRASPHFSEADSTPVYRCILRLCPEALL